MSCCTGNSFTGDDAYCTCFEPVHDMGQQPVQEGPMELAAKCCHDCAYRMDSPERDHGLALPDRTDQAFSCHPGKRKGLSCTRSASWLVAGKPRCSAHTPVWPRPDELVTTLTDRDVYAVRSAREREEGADAL